MLKLFSHRLFSNKARKLTSKSTSEEVFHFIHITEYIMDMLNLKKSIDKILEEMTHKNIQLFSAKDKAFKKILDSIEAARNLADHTDFTIKECTYSLIYRLGIRLKLDEERSL